MTERLNMSKQQLSSDIVHAMDTGVASRSADSVAMSRANGAVSPTFAAATQMLQRVSAAHQHQRSMSPTSPATPSVSFSYFHSRSASERSTPASTMRPTAADSDHASVSVMEATPSSLPFQFPTSPEASPSTTTSQPSSQPTSPSASAISPKSPLGGKPSRLGSPSSRHLTTSKERHAAFAWSASRRTKSTVPRMEESPSASYVPPVRASDERYHESIPIASPEPPHNRNASNGGVVGNHFHYQNTVADTPVPASIPIASPSPLPAVSSLIPARQQTLMSIAAAETGSISAGASAPGSPLPPTSASVPLDNYSSSSLKLAFDQVAHSGSATPILSARSETRSRETSASQPTSQSTPAAPVATGAAAVPSISAAAASFVVPSSNLPPRSTTPATSTLLGNGNNIVSSNQVASHSTRPSSSLSNVSVTSLSDSVHSYYVHHQLNASSPMHSRSPSSFNPHTFHHHHHNQSIQFQDNNHHSAPASRDSPAPNVAAVATAINDASTPADSVQGGGAAVQAQIAPPEAGYATTKQLSQEDTAAAAVVTMKSPQRRSSSRASSSSRSLAERRASVMLSTASFDQKKIITKPEKRTKPQHQMPLAIVAANTSTSPIRPLKMKTEPVMEEEEKQMAGSASFDNPIVGSITGTYRAHTQLSSSLAIPQLPQPKLPPLIGQKPPTIAVAPDIAEKGVSCRGGNCCSSRYRKSQAQREAHINSAAYDPELEACTCSDDFKRLHSFRARQASITSSEQLELVGRLWSWARSAKEKVAEKKAIQKRKEMDQVFQFKREPRSDPLLLAATIQANNLLNSTNEAAAHQAFQQANQLALAQALLAAEAKAVARRNPLLIDQEEEEEKTQPKLRTRKNKKAGGHKSTPSSADVAALLSSSLPLKILSSSSAGSGLTVSDPLQRTAATDSASASGDRTVYSVGLTHLSASAPVGSLHPIIESNSNSSSANSTTSVKTAAEIIAAAQASASSFASFKPSLTSSSLPPENLISASPIIADASVVSLGPFTPTSASRAMEAAMAPTIRTSVSNTTVSASAAASTTSSAKPARAAASSTSAAALSSTAPTVSGLDFATSLYYRSLLEQESHRARMEQIAKEQYSFAPAINNRSREIAAMTNAGKTEEEKEHMKENPYAKKPKAQIQHVAPVGHKRRSKSSGGGLGHSRRATVSDLDPKLFTFQPTINDASRTMASASPAHHSIPSASPVPSSVISATSSSNSATVAASGVDYNHILHLAGSAKHPSPRKTQRMQHHAEARATAMPFSPQLRHTVAPTREQLSRTSKGFRYQFQQDQTTMGDFFGYGAKRDKALSDAGIETTKPLPDGEDLISQLSRPSSRLSRSATPLPSSLSPHQHTVQHQLLHPLPPQHRTPRRSQSASPMLMSTGHYRDNMSTPNAKSTQLSNSLSPMRVVLTPPPVAPSAERKEESAAADTSSPRVADEENNKKDDSIAGDAAFDIAVRDLSPSVAATPLAPSVASIPSTTVRKMRERDGVGRSTPLSNTASPATSLGLSSFSQMASPHLDAHAQAMSRLEEAHLSGTMSPHQMNHLRASVLSTTRSLTRSLSPRAMSENSLRFGRSPGRNLDVRLATASPRCSDIVSVVESDRSRSMSPRPPSLTRLSRPSSCSPFKRRHPIQAPTGFVSPHIHARLKTWKERQDERREKERLEREQEEMVECTFKPAINSTEYELQRKVKHSATTRSNIIARAQKIAQRLVQASSKEEEETPSSSPPVIAPCSIAVDDASAELVSIGSHLERQVKARAKRQVEADIMAGALREKVLYKFAAAKKQQQQGDLLPKRSSSRNSSMSNLATRSFHISTVGSYARLHSQAGSLATTQDFTNAPFLFEVEQNGNNSRRSRSKQRGGHPAMTLTLTTEDSITVPTSNGGIPFRLPLSGETSPSLGPQISPGGFRYPPSSPMRHDSSAASLLSPETTLAELSRLNLGNAIGVSPNHQAVARRLSAETLTLNPTFSEAASVENANRPLKPFTIPDTLLRFSPGTSPARSRSNSALHSSPRFPRSPRSGVAALAPQNHKAAPTTTAVTYQVDHSSSLRASLASVLAGLPNLNGLLAKSGSTADEQRPVPVPVAVPTETTHYYHSSTQAPAESAPAYPQASPSFSSSPASSSPRASSRSRFNALDFRTPWPVEDVSPTATTAVPPLAESPRSAFRAYNNQNGTTATQAPQSVVNVAQPVVESIPRSGGVSELSASLAALTASMNALSAKYANSQPLTAEPVLSSVEIEDESEMLSGDASYSDDFSHGAHSDAD